MKTNAAIDSAIQQYAELMIKNIENIKNGWQKGWITANYSGEPTNILGKIYHGVNPFALTLYCMAKGYSIPVFITFKQCKAHDISVLKGEKAFPILFWTMCPYKVGNTGKNITIGEYDNLSDREKQEYKLLPVLRRYLVFNIAQTDCETANPNLWNRLKAKYSGDVKRFEDTDGMYENEHLDKLIGGQWLCKVSCREQDNAFYRPSTDEIVLPLKAQFKRGKTAEEVYADGQEFYGTAIHEMIHSTGIKSRLNRTMGMFGNKDYAHEEFVAELSAAFIGNQLGFATRVQDNNAAYLNSWLKTCKEKPNDLLKILGCVDKAVTLFNERFNQTA